MTLFDSQILDSKKKFSYFFRKLSIEMFYVGSWYLDFLVQYENFEFQSKF